MDKDSKRVMSLWPRLGTVVEGGEGGEVDGKSRQPRGWRRESIDREHEGGKALDVCVILRFARQDASSIACERESSVSCTSWVI
jgi:hypothetical protein